ncbi:branched-chain amino acid ABC transporter permease [Roseomonas chloroacetimidivorans]|jgi:branched-chain amino acid transport system permease protein|uniref:branched-chain amino acid ABC transporter permease n=1 Tax=Roseomonas chloroacetimidivorans TaxID=1766656 RepID=UPI003C76927A
MDLGELVACMGSLSCVVTQVSAGLTIGLLLFLVASGLTLIFGVLGLVNFAHGTLYMLGAYFALSAYGLTESFLVATAAGALGVAVFGLLMERTLFRRIYGADVLMQLLVCYAIILIMDDVVKIVWGGDFLKMDMPETFRRPPLLIGGGIVPLFYLVLFGITLAVALLLALGMSRTRFGRTVRAAAVNPTMVASLGVNTSLVFAAVFAIGAGLAGLAGALSAPIRSVVPGAGVSILIESFIVTVIGGMGSIGGALAAALLIGLTRSFGSIGFPLFTEGLMFLMMAAILLVKPSGLAGKHLA